MARILLIINVLSFIFAFGLYVITAYFLNSFILLLLAVILVVMFRSIVSEMFIMKLIKVKLKKDFFIEFLLTCAFIISTQYFTRIGGFIFYLCFLIIYTYINWGSIRKTIVTNSL